jgi:outer membrane lipoprotein-sorting protein
MSQFNVPMESDLLDEATELLRDSRGADMPQGLVATTVDAIRNRPTPAVNRDTGGRQLLPLGSIAAMLLILAVITTVFTQGGARVALAQVIDKVKDADSVEFVLVPGRGDNAGNQQKCLLIGKRLRVQHPVGIVMIADRGTKKGLYLDATNKSFCRFMLHEHLAKEFATDPITQLRQVKADGATRLSQEVVNGKATEVFRVRGVNLFGTESAKGETRIWVDPTTMLPMRIELRMGETPVLTLKEIQWDSKIDPSLLAQEIPDGYSDQPEVAFRKRLQPAGNPDNSLTPTEAFRKWRGDNQ